MTEINYNPVLLAALAQVVPDAVDSEKLLENAAYQGLTKEYVDQVAMMMEADLFISSIACTGEINLSKVGQVDIDQSAESELMSNDDSAREAVDMEAKSVVTLSSVIQLPNGKVGEMYQAKIESSVSELVAVSVDLPTTTGLIFNQETQLLSGVPVCSADFQFNVQFSDGESDFAAQGKCCFFINPDPSSLWQCIEPDPLLPFPKPHSDSQLVETENGVMLVASRRGRSHEHKGLYRDDDGLVATLTNGWNLLVVSDGAGSAKLSRLGSSIIVESVKTSLESYLSNDKELDEAIRQSQTSSNSEKNLALNSMARQLHVMFFEMCRDAVMKIQDASEMIGAPDREFASTILVSVLKKLDTGYLCASFGIGDGVIAIYSPTTGDVKLMNELDSGEFAGQTRFLDANELRSPQFGNRIKVSLLTDNEVLLMMTDGVSDPYFEPECKLQETGAWQTFWGDLVPSLSAREPEKALIDTLHFFVKGHHDDRTLALFKPVADISESKE
jgi:hypothetical protein